MLLWTGSQEKGAGQPAAPGRGSATLGVLAHPKTTAGSLGARRWEALGLPPYSPVGPLNPSPARQSQAKGDGVEKCQLEKGTGCQAEESAVPS